MPGREPKDVVDELFRRVVARDFAVIDELMAEDMVNHAAGGADDLRGPQGREGWKQILATLTNDLGDEITVDHHHVVAEGDLVVDHMTLHGRHRDSTRTRGRSLGQISPRGHACPDRIVSAYR